MTNLCLNACMELLEHGFKKDIDPTSLKESFNIAKLQNGNWCKSTKPSLHEAAVLTPLELEKMPALKELTESLEELDKEIRKEGGRIFISEYLVYKIKKGTQTVLIAYENTEKEDGKYRKLCDEMIEAGLKRDRFRTEETYILTKNAGNEWSMAIGHENHSGKKVILDLKKMPLFKMIASKIIRTDSKFHINGGRLFITPTRLYRLNNKIETIFKLS